MFLTVMTYKTPSRGLLSPGFTVACGDTSSASHVSDISGSSTGGAALVAAGPTGRPIHHHGRVRLGSREAVWGRSARAEPWGWPGRPGGHLQLRVQVSVLPRGRPLQLNKQEVSRGNFGFYLTWEIVPFVRLSLRTSRGWVLWSSIAPGVLLEGFSVGSALKILHFLEKLHVLLSILAQIHKKQGLPWWLRQ